MVEYIIFSLKPDKHDTLDEIKALSSDIVADYCTLMVNFDWHDAQTWICGYCKKKEYEKIKDNLKTYPRYNTSGIGFTLTLEDNIDTKKVKEDLEAITKSIEFDCYPVGVSKVTDITKGVDVYRHPNSNKKIAEVRIGTFVKGIKYNVSCYANDPEEFEDLFKLRLGIKTRIDFWGLSASYFPMNAPSVPDKFKDRIKEIKCSE